tara:strand:- start:2 stop:9907 length:9906 start_codon:yes stop_codon:yes gene_type:complete
MLYKNFKTDQTFNQLELEEAANAENIGIDEYITKYDLQMIPDPDSVDEPEVESEIAPPEINIDIPKGKEFTQEIKDFDLDTDTLEDVYQEVESEVYNPLREAEEELKRIVDNPTASPLFNLSRIKSAKDRIAEEKRKLYSADSEVNLDVPETIIGKSADIAFAALEKEYPSINFDLVGKGAGSEVIRVDLGGEILELELDPWTSTGEAEAMEVLEKIKKYDAKLNVEERFFGVATGLFNAYENEEIGSSFLNEQLDLMGLELVRIPGPSKLNRTQLVDKATGEVLAEDTFHGYNVLEKYDKPKTTQSTIDPSIDLDEEGNIQAFLRNKLNPAQKKALKDKSFEILYTVAEVKALTKKEQTDLIENNPAKTWGLYARDGFSNIINLMSDPGRSNPQLTKIDGSPVFTKEEIELFTSRMNTLKNYLFQGGGTSFASPTTGITTGGGGGDSIASSQYKNIIEGYLQGKKYGNVPPLPPELLEKLLAGDWLEKGLKTGLTNVQEKQLNRATKPLYNTIMSELGEDETLLELAKRWEGLPTDMLKDEIKEKIDRVKVADANIVDIFDFKINEIWNNLPKGSRLNYTDINGDVVAEIAWEGEGELSKEEKKNFDEQSTEFYKLQTTIKRLQEEKRDYVFQVLQNTKLIQDYNEGVDHELTDLAFKEYGLGALLARDFWNATKSIGLTVPTLLGSDWAQNEQKLMNMDDQYYKDMVAPELSVEYVLRTLGQQMPNVIMAIGTGSVGTRFLSDAATKWAIAGTFGFSSGTEKYRQLNIQQDLYQIALDQRNVLTKARKEGRIDEFNYATAMADINQTLAFSKMTDNQILWSSMANGIVEGTVTRFVAGAPNTMRILKDFKGSPNIFRHVSRTPKQQLGMYFKDYTGRLGLEVIEEEMIYFGQQGIGEWGILDREFDLSHADEVFWATIVTAGVSQGPGIVYSAATNMTIHANLRKEIKKLITEGNDVSALMSGELTGERLNTMIDAYARILQEMAAKQDALGIDVLGLGPQKMQELIEYNILQKALYAKAGVTVAMDEKQRSKALANYENTLTTDQKKEFKKDLNDLEKAIYKIQNGPKDYNKVKEIIGKDFYKYWVDKLNDESPPGWRSSLPLNEKLGFVINEIRKQAKADQITRAKENPEMHQWVDNQIEAMAMAMQENGVKNPKISKKEIDKLWELAGGVHGDMHRRALTNTSEVNRNAKELLGEEWASNLKILEIPAGESVIDYLTRMVEEKEITMDYVQELHDAMEKGGFGFIVGNKYIVRNKKEADEEMARTGNLRASVVILHEVDHAMIDAYMGNTMVDGKTVLSEEGNEYVLNLEEAMRTHENEVFRGLHQRVEAALLEVFGTRDSKGNFLPFAEQNDHFKDEYSNEIKTALFSTQGYEHELEVSESLIDKIFWTQAGMKINTPKKALDFVLTSNAAFRKGRTTTKFRRKVGKKPIKPTKGIKESKQLVTQINQKNKGVENFTPVTADQLTTMVDKIANRSWTKLGSKVPLNIRQKFWGRKGDESGRQKWLDNAKPILQSIALKYDASKATFESYMANTGMQRANTWVKDLGIPDSKRTRVGIESKQVQSKTIATEEDFKARAEKEAKEITPSLKSKIKGKKKPTLLGETKQAVAKEIKYKLPKYNEDLTVKQKTNLVKELGKGLPMTEVEVTRDGKTKKQKLFHSVIDFMGAKNKTVGEYDAWLAENYTTLLGPNGLTTTYLSKAFPHAVEKYVIGEGWVKYPKWKGKKTGTKPGSIATWRSAEEGPYQGSVANLQKMRRVKDIKNTIPLAAFKGKYIKYKDGKLKIPQMPTEGLAKQIAKEIGLKTFAEELQKDNSEIKKDFKARQDLLGAIILENFVEQISLDLQREGVKYSIKNLDFDTASMWLDERFTFFERIQKAFPGLQSKLSRGNTIKTLINIHKSVYGKRIEAEDHIAIAEHFANLLMIPLKATEGFYKTPQFFDYLEDIVEATDTNEAIIAFTGADTAIAQMLTQVESIMEGRRVIEDVFVPYLIKKHGKKKALILLATFAPGTFSNGSKYAASLDTENNFEEHDRTIRPTLFGKKDVDILENIIKKHFPDVKSIARNKITFTKESGKKSIELDINTRAEILEKYLKDQLTIEDLDKMDADAHKAWEFTVDLMESLSIPTGIATAKDVKNGDAKKVGEKMYMDNNTMALILAVSNGGMHTSLRLGAKVWGRSTVMKYGLKIPKIRDGKQQYEREKIINSKGEWEWQFRRDKDNKKIKIYESAYRYEHSLPARVVLWYLYDSIINKNKSIDLELLEDDYRVNIIPRKEMDDVLTEAGLGQTMLASYKPGDGTWWKRMYNIFTFGRMPYAIESLRDPKNKIGEAWEAYFKNNKSPLIKLNAQQTINFIIKADIAIAKATNSIKWSENIKGISVFDFDDTLAETKEKVIVHMPYYAPGSTTEATMELTPAEFAEQAQDLESMGAAFDFSQFENVLGAKKGPLADLALKRQDKFGSGDIFILTARPQSAAPGIKTFLDGIGLNIPLKNIVGLEKGTPKAKADWIVAKAAEGYNNFYFADDVLKNVKAVDDVLNVLDVKSKVQQARVKFSENLKIRLNNMIERHKNVKTQYTYSQVVASRKGRKKGAWTLFIPASADDFRGLTQYTFAGKGKQGEADQKFFDESLIFPYTRGIGEMEIARRSISNDYRALKVAMPLSGFKNVFGNLKKIEGTEYTYDEALRVHLWTKAGIDMRDHGMSGRDQKMLDKIIRENPELLAFAEGVLLITKKDTYMPPSQHWMVGTILGDLNSLTEKVNRKEYLAEFITNVDIMFDEKTLNKIEALYGTRKRKALENIIYRMKTGSNRTSGKGDDVIVNKWNNWVNRSIGAIMFLNRRSALLQLMSTVNFINWSDNNPLKAGIAFANQPQFWSDTVYLFNSPKLKQRRAGLKGDVNEAEIAAAVKGATDKTSAFISVLLKYGFTFTQIADSVAISTGGATFYRNRINTYKKQVNPDTNKLYTIEEAEKKAFEDFSLISDETQQSADPMLISQEQAGTMGRLILAFQNTPMQYTRLMKKAAMDLAAGRGDAKTHISKIIYYGMIQNFIFSALQAALFGVIPGFDEEPEDEEGVLRDQQNADKKARRILNGMIDTILRGSGLKGAVLAAIKNTINQYYTQEAKGFLADHTYTVLEAINLSPPIGSKARKFYAAIQTNKFNRDAVSERGFDVTIDGKFNLSPTYSIIGNLASALLNIPLDRITTETDAIVEAFDSRNTEWQRLALSLGWRTWDVNAKNEEHDLIKAAGKARRKKEGIEKGKRTRAETKRKKDSIYDALPADVKLNIELNKKMRSFQKKLQKYK